MTQTPQHYRISLADAIAHYQQGDLTAKGLLHFYLKIRLKAGWTLKETQKEICEQLGISRAAFYSALSKLKAEGSINWSAPANTKFSISLVVCERGQDSTIVDEPSAYMDTTSTYIDSQSTIVDSPSIIVTGEKTEGIQSKDSNNSSYSSSNLLSNSFSDSLSTKPRERDSFSVFKESLIPEEFESFWEFAMYVAKSFRPTLKTEAIRLPEAWIKKYHQELYNQFLDGLEQQHGSRSFAEILDRDKYSAGYSTKEEKGYDW